MVDLSDFEGEFDPVDDVVMVTASAEQLAMANPFGERECAMVELDARPVNVSQLADEIEREAGHPVQLSVTNQPEGPSRLFVTPVVEHAVLRTVLDHHEADDDYGVPADERERRMLLDKLREGEELTPDEMAKALRLALERS